MCSHILRFWFWSNINYFDMLHIVHNKQKRDDYGHHSNRKCTKNEASTDNDVPNKKTVSELIKNFIQHRISSYCVSLKRLHRQYLCHWPVWADQTINSTPRVRLTAIQGKISSIPTWTICARQRISGQWYLLICPAPSTIKNGPSLCWLGLTLCRMNDRVANKKWGLAVMGGSEIESLSKYIVDKTSNNSIPNIL